MAEKYASNKASSLLDALDSSFLPSESRRNQAPAAFSESPLRKASASQWGPSSEASGSGLGGAGALDSARATQRLGNAAMSRTGDGVFVTA
jgi:hypothetical protein